MDLNFPGFPQKSPIGETLIFSCDRPLDAQFNSTRPRSGDLGYEEFLVAIRLNGVRCQFHRINNPWAVTEFILCDCHFSVVHERSFFTTEKRQSQWGIPPPMWDSIPGVPMSNFRRVSRPYCGGR